MALPVVEKAPTTKVNSKQLYWAFAVLTLIAFLLILLKNYNPEAIITSISGLFFGYIMQRSRFCFAAAFRDIFMIRNTSVSRAVLLLLFLTSVGFALIQLFTGDALPGGGIIYPVGFHTVAGGIIFGFGMVIAGNCVTGCLMRMGEGYVMQWYTFLGLLIGSVLGAWNLSWWGPTFIKRSPIVFFPENFGWTAAILLYFIVFALLYLLAIWYERGSLQSIKPGNWWKLNQLNTIASSIRTIFSSRNWSYTLGAVALSIVSILTFYFWGRPPGVSSGLTHLAGWLSCQLGFLQCDWYYFRELIYHESARIYLEHPLLYLAAAFVAGSSFASLLHGEFKVRPVKSGKFIISALVGGTLLGYSSRVAMGCNFGGFWGGLGSFSLHAWVFGLFILIGAYIGGKFFMRYLL
ncbi:MAG: YeeE/YedE family protein [Bacillota bacterium]